MTEEANRVGVAITAGLLVAKCQEAARKGAARNEGSDRGERRPSRVGAHSRTAVLLLAGAAACWFLPQPWTLYAEARSAFGAGKPRYIGECLLAELPSVQSDAIARVVIADCHSLYPKRPMGIAPIESFPDRRTCIRAKARTTDSEVAAQKIVEACSRLYS